MGKQGKILQGNKQDRKIARQNKRKKAVSRFKKS